MRMLTEEERAWLAAEDTNTENDISDDELRIVEGLRRFGRAQWIKQPDCLRARNTWLGDLALRVDDIIRGLT